MYGAEFIGNLHLTFAIETVSEGETWQERESEREEAQNCRMAKVVEMESSWKTGEQHGRSVWNMEINPYNN